MLDVNIRRRILIAAACAALWLTCMAGAALPAEQLESSFKVLGPIPSNTSDLSLLFAHPEDPGQIFERAKSSDRGCLRARSDAYDRLKFWQREMHASLGKNVRRAIKNAEAEKAATKDPKRKKQIGEWETRLSVASQKLFQQIDDENEAAVKQVHFKIPCPAK